MDQQEAMKLARRLLERGDVKAAARRLTRLNASPFLLARLSRLSGALEHALSQCDAALKSSPQDLSVWCELALVARALKDRDALSKRTTEAKLPDPLSQALGRIYGGKPITLPPAQGKQSKLIALAHKALAKGKGQDAARVIGPPTPQDGPMMRLFRAELGLERGQIAQADAGLRSLAKAFPVALDVLLLRAETHMRAGQAGQAAPLAVQAAEYAPRDPRTVHLAIRCLLEINATPRARMIWEMAVAHGVKPASLGLLEVQLLEAEERYASAAKIATLRAKTGEEFGYVGHLNERAGAPEAALTQFDQALKRAPNLPRARLERAQILQSLGEAEKAEDALRTLLRDNPYDGHAARALANGVKLSADDPIVSAMKTAYANPDVDDDNRRMFAFALGKIAADTDAHGEMFAYLNVANNISAQRSPYDEDADRSEEQHIKGSLTDALRHVSATGPDTPQPIFITGMPRSGTTLIERIIATHSLVTEAGELGAINKAFSDLKDQLLFGTGVTPEDLSEAAQLYGEGVRERTGSLPDRFTDKSIHSFAHIGLIRKVLPSAKIVVVRRDPRDVGLSIYRNHFPDGTHRYSTDLKHIAGHIAFFDRMVRHWGEVDPKSFYEISYEALIADPETETRRLLAACDLPWEEACLNFHMAKNQVKTLSFAQVRQPLYTSSKGGWRRCEADLQPLIEELTAQGIEFPD